MSKNQQNRQNRKNSKKGSMPDNVVHVNFAKKVRGHISRGHVHLGIIVGPRNYKLRDRFEDTYFVLNGEVHVRLTMEILTTLQKDGRFTDYAMDLTVDGDTVRAKLSLEGVDAKTSFDAEGISLMLHFLKEGGEVGRALGRLLSGQPVNAGGSHRNRGGKGNQANRIVRQLEKGGRGKRSAPGGAKLGDLFGKQLQDAATDAKPMSRKQKANLDRKKAKKQDDAPKAVPAPQPEPAPEPVEVDTDASDRPTMSKRSARMFVQQLKDNGGDLSALNVTNPANLRVIRDVAEEAGVVLKETKHLLQ